MNPRPNTSPLPSELSRRTVLGVAVAGTAGLLTAACGGSSTTTGTTTGTASGSGSSPSPAGSSPGSGGGASNGLVKTTKVPVGEGVILTGQKIVVTQPTAGEFKGFSAICTHMACTVSEIKKGTIICPCHGSAYKITDGSTTVNPDTGVKGPAPRALSKVAIKVVGDEIVKA